MSVPFTAWIVLTMCALKTCALLYMTGDMKEEKTELIPAPVLLVRALT